MWHIEFTGKSTLKLNDAVLISGLPGIGNVGKIAVDFMIDQLKAKEHCSFFSYKLPASVFVKENNLVELPTINLYCLKRKKNQQDIIFLAGDVQPTEEEAAYLLAEKIVEMCTQLKIKEIVTLGGIGLTAQPASPKIYCTANTSLMLKKYSLPKVNTQIYGVVGPIMGITGLLLGLGKKQNIGGVALLAETHAHPLHFGVKGALGILSVLDSSFDLSLDLKKFEQDIKNISTEKKQLQRPVAKNGESKSLHLADVNYIG